MLTAGGAAVVFPPPPSNSVCAIPSQPRSSGGDGVGRTNAGGLGKLFWLVVVLLCVARCTHTHAQARTEG
jgi:hypothetical protein